MDSVILLSSTWRMCEYKNGLWVIVVSCNHQCMVSTDCIHWDIVDIGISDSWHGISVQNDYFIIIGKHYFAYSLDGLKWEYSKQDLSKNIMHHNCIEYTGLPVHVQYDLFIEYMSDISKYITLSNELIVDKNTDEYMAINGKQFAVSEDGIYWNRVDGIDGKWLSMCYGDNKWVVVGYEDKCLIRKDGKWKTFNLPAKGMWYSVTYKDRKWVALMGGSNLIAVSTDGITWMDIDLPIYDLKNMHRTQIM